MLGVGRAGTTETLHSLDTQQLIRAERGEIVVLDRKGIEGREPYGIPEPNFGD
jgi:hypothetical protein